MQDKGDDAVPGWDAIDAALNRIYGGREPLHWGTIHRWRLGGPDPLDGISAYKNLAPVPHWHFVGYGLTELYAKETSDPEVSGHGYELTFRLACGLADERPPNWALNFLQNVARSVAEGESVFGVHHTVDANGPIAVGDPTKITAFAFMTDPQLPPMDTPHGRVEFLQIVGLTGDELTAKQAWDVEKVFELLAEGNPLLVTDLRRPSLLDDPVKAARIRDGIEREGSSVGTLFVSELRWRKPLLRRQAELTIGALVVPVVLSLLRSRTLRGKPFSLVDEPGGASATVLPAAAAGWATRESVLEVSASSDLVEQMLHRLEPRRGRYTFDALPGFTVVVEPSEIRDGRGCVVEVRG